MGRVTSILQLTSTSIDHASGACILSQLPIYRLNLSTYILTCKALLQKNTCPNKEMLTGNKDIPSFLPELQLGFQMRRMIQLL